MISSQTVPIPMLVQAVLLLLVKKSDGFSIAPSSTTATVHRLNHLHHYQPYSPVRIATITKRSGSTITAVQLFGGGGGFSSDNDVATTVVDQSTTTESNKPKGLFFEDNIDGSDLGKANRLSLVLQTTRDVLDPAAQALDDATDGWALSYADLSPETETTPVGQAFLGTNIAYALAGVVMAIQGETVLGFLTELASIASFIYHYTQLQASNNVSQDSTVRLALMVDYVFAFASILVANYYIILDGFYAHVDGLVTGGLGLVCLFACWVWEAGTPYILLHSLWHLFSAYSGYTIGVSHIST